MSFCGAEGISLAFLFRFLIRLIEQTENTASINSRFMGILTRA